MKITSFTTVLLKFLFKTIILCYKYLISPLMKQRCRYLPTCSDYAIEMLETHAIPKALWLITKRLISCNPFYKPKQPPH